MLADGIALAAASVVALPSLVVLRRRIVAKALGLVHTCITRFLFGVPALFVEDMNDLPARCFSAELGVVSELLILVV